MISPSIFAAIADNNIDKIPANVHTRENNLTPIIATVTRPNLLFVFFEKATKGQSYNISSLNFSLRINIKKSQQKPQSEADAFFVFFQNCLRTALALQRMGNNHKELLHEQKKMSQKKEPKKHK